MINANTNTQTWLINSTFISGAIGIIIVAVFRALALTLTLFAERALEMLPVRLLFILLDVAGVYLRLIQEGTKAATVGNGCPIATQVILPCMVEQSMVYFGKSPG